LGHKIILTPANERRIINKDLANELHTMVRVRMGLSAISLTQDSALTDSDSEDELDNDTKIKVDEHTKAESIAVQTASSNIQTESSNTQNITEIISLTDAMPGPLVAISKPPSSSQSFLQQLTQATAHIKQQIEESGAFREYETPADHQPAIRQNIPNPRAQQFAISISDIESIKLRSDKTSRPTKELKIPIAKQIDNLIRLFTILQQEEYRDIEEEIRIAFYRQINITNRPYIKSQSLTLLIKNLTEVKENPDGDNFIEFRNKIKETGDVRNFLLNMSGNVDPKTLARFNLIGVYKNHTDVESDKIAVQTPIIDPVVFAANFGDNFFEADFAFAFQQQERQISPQVLTDNLNSEESSSDHKLIAELAAELSRQFTQELSRIYRHSGSAALRDMLESLRRTAINDQDSSSSSKMPDIAMDHDKVKIYKPTAIIVRQARQQDDTDSEPELEIKYRSLNSTRPYLTNDNTANPDPESEILNPDFEARIGLGIADPNMSETPNTETIKATSSAAQSKTTTTTKTETKPKASPANRGRGRGHKKKGRGGGHQKC
jgi:hypothetical protein